MSLSFSGPRNPLHTLLILAAMGTVQGCGHCQTVSSHRNAFLEAQHASTSNSAPHMSIEIPDGMITRMLNTAVDSLPKTPFKLPGLGKAGKYAGSGYAFQPRSMSMIVDRDDAARFALDFDIKDGSKTLFGLQMAAVAPVQFNAKKGEVVIALRADMFEHIQPRIGGNAINKLTSQLLSKVPRAARLLIPKSLIKNAAAKAIDLLAGQAYQLLRRSVLSKIGNLATFRIKVPDMPIAGFALHSLEQGNLRLDFRTTLPAAGLQLSNRSSKLGGDKMRIQISTSALARLGNWAMETGKMPSSYDETGKAKKDGKYTAGLQWAKGARPMKVHMWSMATADTCIHARAGATPKLGFKKGNLSVGFKDGKIEEFTGPPIVKMALSMMDISASAFKFTKKIASSTEIKLGNSKIGVALEQAALDGEIFVLDLGLSGLGDG